MPANVATKAELMQSYRTTSMLLLLVATLNDDENRAILDLHEPQSRLSGWPAICPCSEDSRLKGACGSHESNVLRDHFADVLVRDAEVVAVCGGNSEVMVVEDDSQKETSVTQAQGDEDPDWIYSDLESTMRSGFTTIANPNTDGPSLDTCSKPYFVAGETRNVVRLIGPDKSHWQAIQSASTAKHVRELK